MNTTEDGDEPLGDYLDTPTFVAIVPPQGGPTGIRVIGENERQAIAEIRALHGNLDRDPDYPNLRPVCRECCDYQPCDTNKALDKWGV